MSGVRNRPVFCYGCGTPIRQAVIEAMAVGSKAVGIFNEEFPKYRGGDTIVWGLMRGARELMAETTAAGCDFYQMDNAYFGRENFFRVTKNGLQLTKLKKCDESRYKDQFLISGIRMSSWKKKRGEQILICTSSSLLYEFHNTNIQSWLDGTVEKISKFSRRPISIRVKQLGNIEDDLAKSWIVVTHSSASALDALLYGIPVITTAPCAATPMATSLDEIERPRSTANRAALFSTLSWGQFTIDEMKSGFAWKYVSNQ